MADKHVTAVVIDDHPVLRGGIASLCRNSDPPIDVVATGSDIDTAFKGPALKADVVILDLHLETPDPSLQGLRTLVETKRNVVIYTHDVNLTTARRCIRYGAKAYVTKGEAEEHLMHAVRDAVAGLRYTTPTVSAAMLSDPQFPRVKLADQELRALKGWFALKSMRLVADSMNVTQSTVKTYIDRARDKYEAAGQPAPNSFALIRRALEDGLIDLSELGSGDWRG
ncbi:response regulator [Actinomadura formosensis]|uniref:response regulator n=1 Tax=Actinomadura formosensis TaxID=60706 RepID=UPI000835EA51|nr:response regulator transcription factor [Actinomadura formosensis]